MAGIQSLISTLNGGAGSILSPSFRVQTKFNLAHVKKKVKQGNLKALDRAGSIVRQSAKKQFSHRTVKAKPRWSLVGKKNGDNVLSMDFRPPLSGKITSWKNPRGRGATQTGFLRTLIRYDVDNKSESVVIGPTNAATWLNTLQEFGGSATRVLRLIGRYPINPKRPNQLLEKNPPPSALLGASVSRRRKSRGWYSGRGVYVGVWIDPAHTKRRKTMDLARNAGRVPPARFMKKGLDAKLVKLAEQWRGKISGP